MVKIRPACAYRKIKRAYTRTSKVKSKSYVKGVPHVKVVQFDMGDKTTSFPYEVTMVANHDIQVRDSALESARQVLVRTLETVSKTGWAIKVRAVPHHILRLHSLATGAGSDRLSRGMTLAFGRPDAHAAQVFKGKVLYSLYVPEDKIELAKLAASKAVKKLPVRCTIKVNKRA